MSEKTGHHRALIEKGFTVSYSSACKYIQQRKTEKSRKPKDVFVKQYYEPGEECEFDWGEVKLRIGGKPVTFTMAVFALCHSEGRWAYLFRHQDNLAFMESHRNFFHDVHGVPHTMVYDNMKVAVILKPDGKKPTETLLRMCAFYGYGYRFCNARAGWEKGHVERSVDYVRGRAFTTPSRAAITPCPTTLPESLSSCSCTAKRYASMTRPARRWQSMNAATQTGTSYRIKETKKYISNK